MKDLVAYYKSDIKATNLDSFQLEKSALDKYMASRSYFIGDSIFTAEKLEKQKNTFYRDRKSGKYPDPTQSYYPISRQWFRYWEKITQAGYFTSFLGAINNEPISNTGHDLRTDIVPGRDYEPVTKELFEMLKKCFGGPFHGSQDISMTGDKLKQLLDFLCSMCKKAQQPSIVFLPCRHLDICKGCENTFMKKHRDLDPKLLCCTLCNQEAIMLKLRM